MASSKTSKITKIGRSWKKLACCLAFKELKLEGEMREEDQIVRISQIYSDPVNTFVDPSDLGSLNERSFFNDGKTAMNGVASLRQ